MGNLEDISFTSQMDKLCARTLGLTLEQYLEKMDRPDVTEEQMKAIIDPTMDFTMGDGTEEDLKRARELFDAL